MLYGNVQDVMTPGNGRKETDIYISNSNIDNGAEFSNKKSDHNSWWHSQSSSSRFSSPSYKSEARGQMKNGGRPTPNTGRGRISRHDIISSPTPNNFAAEDNINEHNRNDKN